jgi:O-antigen ligase
MRGVLVLLALMPPLAALSPSTVGALMPLVSLGLLATYVARGAIRFRWQAPISLLILTVVVLGLISMSWALDPGLAQKKAVKFGLVVLPPLWLALGLAQVDNPQLRSRAAQALGIGMALAALLLAWQTFGDVVLRDAVLGRSTSTPGNKTNVPAAQLAILVWALPTVLASGGRGLWLSSWGIVIAVGATVLAGAGLAPCVAFTVGGFSLWFAARWPRLFAGLLLAGVMGFHLASPRLAALEQRTHQVSDNSIRHRMDIWALAGEYIAERPVLGYGFSNSDRIPAKPGQMALSGTARVFPLYPHNVLMQVQVELGVPGMLLFYAVLICLLRSCLAAPSPLRAAGLSFIAATLSVWCIGYPLWRSAWVAWLLFGALVLCTYGTRAPSRYRAV